MSRKVSIINYHYVRDAVNSEYPKIKGLDVSLFVSQLEYISKNYTPIRMEDLIESVETGKDLPPRAILLSFDDGYIDHFTTAFPLLQKYGIQGSFYPSAKVVAEHTVLDVNKIHYILASVEDDKEIEDRIFSFVHEKRQEHSLESDDYYRRLFLQRDMFNTGRIFFIKRMLQKELKPELRRMLADELFFQYVSDDEKTFSETLYMNKEQIQEMQRKGMHIGSHGFEHTWLDTLTPEQQEKEIDLSVSWLRDLNIFTAGWTFSYPYGMYNDNLLSLLKNKGCAVGLVLEAKVADLDVHRPLALPRFDATDVFSKL